MGSYERWRRRGAFRAGEASALVVEPGEEENGESWYTAMESRNERARDDTRRTRQCVVEMGGKGRGKTGGAQGRRGEMQRRRRRR